MEIKKFFKKRKFWLISLGILILGLVVYFIFFTPRAKISEEKPREIPEEFRGDKSEPASLIESPESGFWQRANFYIDTFDEDLESGVNSEECKYESCAYDSKDEEFCTGWISRQCSSTREITVGEEREMCRFEGREACHIFVSAKDRAGNRGESSSYYHIDWTAPSVGRIFITKNPEEQTYPIRIEKGKEYIFQLKVIDNFKTLRCGFYVDGKFQKMMLLSPSGCSTDCLASLPFIFSSPRSYSLYARCDDLSGNSQKGESIEARMNFPPEISFCKVSPAQGTNQTNFKFEVEAHDPDRDSLSFVWDFGDGESSKESNPSHYYKKPGTYEPRVTVSDRRKEVSCFTAWVTISEE